MTRVIIHLSGKASKVLEEWDIILHFLGNRTLGELAHLGERHDN